MESFVDTRYCGNYRQIPWVFMAISEQFSDLPDQDTLLILSFANSIKIQAPPEYHPVLFATPHLEFPHFFPSLPREEGHNTQLYLSHPVQQTANAPHLYRRI